MRSEIEHDEDELQIEADQSRYFIQAFFESVLHRIKATVEERDRHLRTKEDVQLLGDGSQYHICSWLWQK